MLEGFNGLGTGLGIIMSGTLIVLAFHHDRLDGVYLLVPLLGGLVAFLWFNKYPAKVFPGDTLMLFMGADDRCGGDAVRPLHPDGNHLHADDSRVLPEAQRAFQSGELRLRASNGHLEYHGRMESLTHIMMQTRHITERRLVVLVWIIEAAVCSSVVLADLIL